MAIKDLFIKKEGEGNKSIPTPSPSQSQPQPQPTYYQVPEGSKVNADPVMVGRLQQAIIDKNLPGPDYLELKSTAKGLEGYIPEESRRLEAAFGILKSQYAGRTDLGKQLILNSIDTYLGFVEEERKSGVAACNEERREKLDPKVKRIQELQEKLPGIDAEIARLTAEKEKAVCEINTIESERCGIDAEIKAKEAVFNASVDQFSEMLKSDRNKIESLNI